MNPRDLVLSADLSDADVHGYLRSRGFSEPGRADELLQSLTSQIGVPERFADLLASLLDVLEDTVDPDTALLQFESFVEATSSPLNLVSLLEGNPKALSSLVGILGASPYLTQNLLRNPEYFYWLIEKDRLETVCDREYFDSAARQVSNPFSDRQGALNALRRLRRREALRIGAQDILGLAEMSDVVGQVSALAESILQLTFEVLAGELLEAPRGFAVLGMGKLGGGELNFSSDVDLIFIYERGEDRTKMLRFGREYLKALSEFSPEGHLYRVDLRLRPLGRSGEIAYSEKASYQYYQNVADTSDRLAMIKCRAVAGDQELGARFSEFIQEFVYKRYLDYAAVEEIRWIKRRTDKEMGKRKETLTNIKLGLGGIREVEFFVQSFQILYGGQHPELRTPKTLQALQRLLDGGFVTFDEYHHLRDAYIFMRDLEHKLQLVHDIQTHSLPEENEELLRCARRMGYRSRPGEDQQPTLDRFMGDLQRHNQRVRRIFESLLSDRGDSDSWEDLILNPAVTLDEIRSRLESSNTRDPQGVAEGIQLLQEAPAFPHSPTRMRNILANLLPILVSKSDLAENPRDLFSRLDRFCESLGSRAPFYTELIENESFADRFLRLLAVSPQLSEVIIQNTELLDAFAQPAAEATDLKEKLQLAVDGAKEKGMSGRVALRNFKRREEFKIGIQELQSAGSLENRQRLSSLAEACLAYSFERMRMEFNWLEHTKFCLLALGKLGGEELIFHSDLDLVFVFDDKDESKSPAEFSTCLKLFKEELQQYTESGQAYEVDFRLRPEGRHTAEAIPLSQFYSYFGTRAEAWERLAYVKARPIIQQGLDLQIHDLLFSQPFSVQDRAALSHIRFRKEREIGKEKKKEAFNLKVGRGSLLDIQFTSQYLQINHGVWEPNTFSALVKLVEAGILRDSDAQVLQNALTFYYQLEALQDLRSSKEPDLIYWEEHRNRHLAGLMGLSPEHLNRQYREKSKNVRSIFERIFPEVIKETLP